MKSNKIDEKWVLPLVFADLLFLYIFLPLNLILYFLSKNITYRNAVLIVFSLVFYAFGEPLWIILLIGSTLVDYFNGRVIEENRGKVLAKLALISSIVINLGMLGFFKYSGFLVENLNALTGLSLQVPQLQLPIGISFYTFQTLSYVIDVYRGKVKAQPSYWKFLLFVSLFHQLVAGPIVRYAHIADEIDHRKFSVADFSQGITRFILGLSKKVVLANSLGSLSANILDGNLQGMSVASAWFGIILFTLQIYFDFSGYSDMAIGLGKMFGFHYLENFNYPYVAKTATDFWRRWHMSLGSFFRDYVYIPLGGNRKRVYLNLMLVWLLTGLWHGASWNFVLWGGYYGVLICLERLFLSKLLLKLPKIVSHIYLLFVVIFGWSLFYYTDAEKLLTFVKSLFGLMGNPLTDTMIGATLLNYLFLLIVAVLFCAPVAPRIKAWAQQKCQTRSGGILVYSVALCMNVALLCICSILLVGQTYNPFLYFRF